MWIEPRIAGSDEGAHHFVVALQASRLSQLLNTILDAQVRGSTANQLVACTVGFNAVFSITCTDLSATAATHRWALNSSCQRATLFVHERGAMIGISNPKTLRSSRSTGQEPSCRVHYVVERAAHIRIADRMYLPAKCGSGSSDDAAAVVVACSIHGPALPTATRSLRYH